MSAAVEEAAAKFAAQPAGDPNRQLEVWSGDDFRTANTYPYELPTRPGKVFILRRVDPFDLFMNGIITMPLLNTLQDLDKLQSTIRKNDKWMLEIGDEDKQTLMASMREWAREIVVAPRLVDADDGDPAHLPIRLLTFQDLTCLMYASPGAQAKGRLSEADAARFRHAQPQIDAPDPRAGENVPDRPALLRHDAGPEFFGA